jgi:MYXO-CTERM domain-containing protein
LLLVAAMPRVIVVALSALAFVPAAEAEQATEPPTDPGDPIGPSAEIVGGTTVPEGKWPDAVAVLGLGACSGTLIAPDVVLTAGHCVDANPTRVVANTTDYRRPGGTTVAVRSVTAYPSWETSYDVAVIVLEAPIADVTPRRLGMACTFERFARDTMVQLVGFGLTDVGGEGSNTQLHETTAPVIDPDCSGPGGCVPSIRPGGEFIAGGGGKDSCYGDSGGPVYLDTEHGPVVIGAVSRGLNNAVLPCGGGGIYVRTDKLVPWIEATAGRPVAKDLCSGLPDDEAVRQQGPAGDVIGGCTASTGGAGGLVALLGVVGLAARRRRARHG